MKAFHFYLQNPRVKKILAKGLKQDGFSLVELVIVVAILAILAAVAIPTFNSAAERARQSGIKTSLANRYKECEVSRLIGEDPAQGTALVDGNGIVYDAVAESTDCDDVATGASTQGDDPATFTVDLETGERTADGGDPVAAW